MDSKHPGSQTFPLEETLDPGHTTHQPHDLERFIQYFTFFFFPSITFLGKWLGWKLSERLGTQQALESDDCPPRGAHGCLEGHGRSHEAQRAPLSRVPAVPVPGGPCGLAFHSSCPSSQRLAFFSSLEMQQEAGRVQGRKASPATAEARGCLPVFVNGSTAHSSTRSVVPTASIRDGHRPETSYPGAGEPRSDAGRPLGLLPAM